MANRIAADKFLDALADAGVIRIDRTGARNGDFVTRVVIDAKIGDVLRIYVERIGDDRLLNVATTLEGIEISGVPA